MNKIQLRRVLGVVFTLVIVTILIYSGQTYRDKKEKEKIAEQKNREEKETAEREAKIAEQKRRTEQEVAGKKAKVAEQQQKLEEEIAERQRQEERAIERLRFINQYVSTNFSRKAGLPLVAVAVAAENSAMNHAVSAALIKRFKGEHAELVDSFFKPPLVSDGLFNDVFNGSTSLLHKLGITNSLDALLLARQDVQYSTNAELNNIITANMRFEMVTLAVAGKVENQGWTFTANGTGFRPAEARIQAEERILKQIADKPGMSLGLIGPKN